MPGYVILVEWTDTPKADAYTDWEQQAAAKAATDLTYQQISIERVTYRGWNAADWEFINNYDGEETPVLDRGFVVDPGTGLTSSFEPAS
jgi:hypothetical protein